jgi:hypothetical protein
MTSEPAPPDASSPDRPRLGGVGVSVGVFLVSAAVLALQVLQTRILSVQMWHHHSYMVVTMTLLGFAAAGSVATVLPGLMRGSVRARLAWCGVLFGLSTVGGSLLLGRTADAAAEMTAQGSYVALSVFYSYLLIPYFFAGLVITIALSSAREVGRLYFVNLVGSAAGAWVFIAVITPLGGERLLVLVAVLGPLAALAFAGGGVSGGKRALGGAAVVLAGAVPLFLMAPRWLEVEVASTKAQHHLLGELEGAELLEQSWTPLCRLDFVRLPDTDGRAGQINIYQDGDAITVMHSDESWEAVAPVTLNTLVYVPHVWPRALGVGEARRPRALAIGIGGGIDLRHAREQGAESVLGIEINGETVRKVREDYAEFNGSVYDPPGSETRAEVVVGEGRSTLRRLDERFDVIELSGTDTYTAGNSGAYVLSESYLYTREAFREYFEHLAPSGSLGVIRLAYEKPREGLRLFAIALTELRERGIERPSEHAVVLEEAATYERTGEVIRFTGSVFSPDGFEEGALDTYRLIADKTPGFDLLYMPGDEGDSPYARLARAIDEGTEEEFYASYPWNVRPVADDSPFFFNFHRWSALWSDGGGSTKEWADLTGGPIGLRILGTLLVQTSLLVGALVLLPLLFLRRGGGEAPARNAWRHLAYFLALGAGFMFLEISTVQRLVLFLGHPTYSLTVTLSCFLFFAGLGSLASARFRDRPAAALRRIVPAIALLVLVLAFGLETVLDLALPLPFALRVLVVVAVLAPLNFLMGMPFPLGLGRLEKLSPRLVPWALGANGGASVVGSILCIVLAMQAGFRAVSLIAMAVYLVGCWLFTSGPLAPERTDG